MKNIDRTKLIPALLIVLIIAALLFAVPRLKAVPSIPSTTTPSLEESTLTPIPNTAAPTPVPTATANPEPLIQDAKLECETLYSLDMLNENLGYTDNNDPQIITSLIPDLEINAAGVLAVRTIDGRILRIIDDQEGLNILEIPFSDMMREEAIVETNGLWRLEDINEDHFLVQYTQRGNEFSPGFAIFDHEGNILRKLKIPSDMQGVVVDHGNFQSLFGPARFLSENKMNLLINKQYGYFELTPEEEIGFIYQNPNEGSFVILLGWDNKTYLFHKPTKTTKVSSKQLDLIVDNSFSNVLPDVVSLDDVWISAIDADGNVYYQFGSTNTILVYLSDSHKYKYVASILSTENLTIRTMDQYGNFYGLTRASEDDEYTEIVKCMVVE